MRPMLGHGSRACSWFLLLAAALVLAAAGGTLAAGAPDVDVTGHWASPLEAGGIDLVQSGGRVEGSSYVPEVEIGDISALTEVHGRARG